VFLYENANVRLMNKLSYCGAILFGLATMLLIGGSVFAIANHMRDKQLSNPFCTADYQGGYITEIAPGDISAQDSSGAIHHLLVDENTVFSNDGIHPIASSSLVKLGELVLAYGTFCMSDPPTFMARLIWKAMSSSPGDYNK
jgi:hypothetical protein